MVPLCSQSLRKLDQYVSQVLRRGYHFRTLGKVGLSMRRESGVLLEECEDSRSFPEDDSELFGTMGKDAVITRDYFKLSTGPISIYGSLEHTYLSHSRTVANTIKILLLDMVNCFSSRTLVFGSTAPSSTFELWPRSTNTYQILEGPEPLKMKWSMISVLRESECVN